MCTVYEQARCHGAAAAAAGQLAAELQLARGAYIAGAVSTIDNGPHGVGLGKSDAALDQWPNLLEIWLRAKGLLPPPAPRPSH